MGKKKVKKIPENQNEKQETKRYKVKKNRLSPKVKKYIKITLLVIFILMIIAAGIVIGKLYGICKESKLDVEKVSAKYENSILKDLSGNTIAVLNGDENRETISISEMSQYIPKAFVAIEDERFYDHKGVDIKRTGAATLTYILNGGESSFGGSTITQQLVKNITEEDDRTWQRKVKEMARAYYLTQELSKLQVLELYLNQIFLGGRAYGVEVASKYYFNKSSRELTLLESAFLAGINNSPNNYDAFSTEQEDIDKIKERTKIVLDKMYELGKEQPEHRAAITEEEYKTAIEELNNGIPFNKGTIMQTVYTYHSDAAINQIKSELKEKYNWTEEYANYYIKSGGLTIYTTQNTQLQNIMETEVAKEKYITYSKKNKDDNGNYVTAQTAMVLMDHKTGYVLATVGGIGQKTTAFGLNRATQSARQPGSSMKPIAVLCPGIDSGTITAATVFDDIPYTTGIYKNSKNYGRSYQGLTTIRYNIAQSKNIPMLKAINEIGIDKSVEYLNTVGIYPLEKQKNMTLALGASEASPLQMAAAYSAIANDGVYIEPTFYTKVVDSDGKVILQAEQETKTVISPGTAYIVKEILTQVVKSGTLTYAGISGMSVGAKTGTTDDDYDRWTCGFTPYYTAATWYGFDTNETIRYNGNPAGKIWDEVMETIHKGLEKRKFSDTRPNTVTTARVCKCSGKRATELCEKDPRGSQVYTEYFVKGTVPRESCDCHVQVDICTETGILANEFCTNKETKVFITRPENETGNWQKAKDAEYTLTIKDTCTVHKAPEVVEPPTTIIPPDNPTGPEKPTEPEAPTTPIPEDPPSTEKPNKPDNDGENNNNTNNTTQNTTTGNNTVINNTVANNTIINNNT